MNLLVYIRTVLWSFIGIGRRSGSGEDLARVKPLGLFAVAIVLLVVFLVTLFGLASLAVSTLQ
ncbi:DUF2970 domain-containing protein [Comamonadaceae bacterium G21597-S1]|nr:DUF2970 domain-containing protein [Comamonadaceae bacterium G21597-S1]